MEPDDAGGAETGSAQRAVRSSRKIEWAARDSLVQSRLFDPTCCVFGEIRLETGILSSVFASFWLSFAPPFGRS